MSSVVSDQVTPLWGTDPLTGEWLLGHFEDGPSHGPSSSVLVRSPMQSNVLFCTPIRASLWRLSGVKEGLGLSFTDLGWNSRNRQQQQLTHEVGGGLANSAPEDEILEQVGDEVEWHAEETEHEVADSQGEEENVGHCSHPLVPNQHRNDQRVSQHAEQEYQGV